MVIVWVPLGTEEKVVGVPPTLESSLYEANLLSGPEGNNEIVALFAQPGLVALYVTHK
jgi:hypothetical protein